MTQIYTTSLFLLFTLFSLSASAIDYYWVGGSGNWSDFANHWATSSGGSSFHTQVPQSGDNVYFDSNTTVPTGAGTTSGPIDAGVSYEHMLRAFVDHLVHGAPFPTSGADSIANMAAIDAVYTAAGLPLRGLGEGAGAG